MTNLQFIVGALMLSGFFALTFEKSQPACLTGGGILALSYLS
jgi:hypothetical protein